VIPCSRLGRRPPFQPSFTPHDSFVRHCCTLDASWRSEFLLIRTILALPVVCHIPTKHFAMTPTDPRQPFLPRFPRHWNRSTYNDLESFASSSDFVRPLAGVNLPPDNDLSFSNHADTFHQPVSKVDFPETYENIYEENQQGHETSSSSTSQ
jgi:hypothetical protein